VKVLDGVRELAVGGLAGALAGGLVLGVGARLAMRASAILAGASRRGAITSIGARVGDLTFSGTMQVVLTGLLMGFLGGALFALARPALPERWRGLAFGALGLLLAGGLLLDPSNPDFHRFGPRLVNVPLFGALVVAYGVAQEAAFARLGARLPRGPWWALLWAPVAGLACVAMLAAALLLTDGPALRLAAIAVLALAGLAARVARARPWARRCVLAPALVGAWGLASSVAAILAR